MKRNGKLLSSVAALSLLAAPAVVLPTSGWAAIDEMVVTTRKREENLQDIPVAVSAFSSEMIENKSLRTTSDIMKLIPGVQFEQSFTLSDTRISIRGVNNSRGRASAAVLVDGIDVSGETIGTGGGSSLLNTRLIDLERVEVVKGPQSALYGRNAFAGAVNYITKRPSMDGLEGNVSLDVGEHGKYEVRGRVSGPVVADKLALSLNAATYNVDGYYEHPQTGGDLNGAESDGIGLGVLFEPNEDFTVYANVSYSEDKALPRAAVGRQQDTNYGPAIQQFGMDYVEHTGILRGSEADISQNFYTGEGDSSYPRFAGSEDETFRAAVIMEWDVGDVILKSTTGYLDNEGFIHQDTDFLDGSTADVMAQPGIMSEYLNFTETEYFSQEFTLASNTDGPLNWLVGAEYFDESTESNSVGGSWWIDGFNSAYGPSGFDLCGTAPVPGGIAIPCSYDDATGGGFGTKQITRDSESWSIFGLVGFDVTDQLSVTAEARYIHDEITVGTNTPLSPPELTSLGCPADGTPGGFCSKDSTVALLVDSKTSNALNPRVSVDYSVNDDAMVYFSYSQGTKPGGFATTQMTNPEINAIDPEELTAWEIGTKTSWLDGAVQANGAVYLNIYEDRQISVTKPCSGAPDVQCSGNGNAGKSEHIGAEFDLLWEATDGLTLGMGYSYIDAEFKDLDFAELTDGNPSMSAQARCGAIPLPDPAAGDCAGALVANVPEHAFSFSADYRAPMANGMDWFASASGQWTDERAVLDGEEGYVAMYDSYWNVDAQIGVENDRVRVALYADNLFDDDTVKSGQVINNFSTGVRFLGGPVQNMGVSFLPVPRTVGIRANLKFGG